MKMISHSYGEKKKTKQQNLKIFLVGPKAHIPEAEGDNSTFCFPRNLKTTIDLQM